MILLNGQIISAEVVNPDFDFTIFEQSGQRIGSEFHWRLLKLKWVKIDIAAVFVHLSFMNVDNIVCVLLSLLVRGCGVEFVLISDHCHIYFLPFQGDLSMLHVVMSACLLSRAIWSPG